MATTPRKLETEVSVFASRSLEIAQIQHGHDGEWHDMTEVTDTSSANEDPERGWLRGRIFRCADCDTQIRVQVPDEPTETIEPL